MRNISGKPSITSKTPCPEASACATRESRAVSKRPSAPSTPSTISLLANCRSWAKHRRCKAAAKLHLRLSLQTFLPSCAIIEEVSHHHDTRTPALFAHLQDGEIALFDKLYIHFLHLFALHRSGVEWDTRAKDNMAYAVRKKLLAKPAGKICETTSSCSKGQKAAANTLS